MNHLDTYDLFEKTVYDQYPDELRQDWEYFQEFYLENEHDELKGKISPPDLKTVKFIGRWNYEGDFKGSDPYKIVTPEMRKASMEYIKKYPILYRAVFNADWVKDKNTIEKIYAAGTYTSKEKFGYFFGIVDMG